VMFAGSPGAFKISDSAMCNPLILICGENTFSEIALSRQSFAWQENCRRPLPSAIWYKVYEAYEPSRQRTIVVMPSCVLKIFSVR
jgi:hypothetical protein